jgi:peroxiredoxin
MQTRLNQVALLCIAFVGVRLISAQEHEATTAFDAAQTARVGQDAPDFTLLDCNGKKHALSAYKEKIVVLEWINQQCPYSVAAVPVIKELRKKFAGNDVVWLGVESTHWRKPEENVQYAKDKGLDFPILMDNDGAVGRKYVAKTTPHIYIINKGKLVYAGALHARLESGSQPGPDTRKYVDEALTAILEGKSVPVVETTPWGCSVKYKSSGEVKKDDKPGDDKT